MKSLVLGSLLFLLGSCTASMRYPGYEYVRIEASIPSSECKYVVQEACPRPSALEGCYNYFKKRATTYDANTVVLDQNDLASYYVCP